MVVLSNGFKISPLDTEALITTHSAVDGCLVIGTGKPQAGLLIELKDPSVRHNDLFDSIWSTVERANNQTFQKTRIQRQYIAFAESDKPFIRTDKRTIKRRATLDLYADFIERFYSSRGEDIDGEDIEVFPVDTSSVEAIITSISDIIGSIVPEIGVCSPEEDIFELGLDSLLVFRLVNIIRAAIGLQEQQLAPRHLYASPTIATFAAQVARILEEVKRGQTVSKDVANKSTQGDSTATISAPHLQTNIQGMIAEHKRRLGFKMNPFDAVNPNHYMGLNFYFALRPEITFQDAFTRLQSGLVRAFQIIPELDGKMLLASEHEVGYKKGEYRITIPPRPLSGSSKPRQLTYKDLSQVLPSFEKMRESNFAPSLFHDKLVLDSYPFPEMPADVIVAQANFVEGGCILSTNFIHTCLDGIGVMVALRVWAECTRYLDGDQTATCEWFDPESFNHSLPEILHDVEGYAKEAHEIDPGVWGFLPFFRPDDFIAGSNPEDHPISSKERNGHVKGSPKAYAAHTSEAALPPAPVFPRQPVWPAAPSERSLSTSVFLISNERLQMLKEEVLADPETKGIVMSISDIVQAFFWRMSIRSRYRVAKETRGATFDATCMSILELPIDGRPYFSPSLPSSYMGSMLILNRPTMPIETLCSPHTSIGKIASLIREAASRITPSLVHDAFTLLRSMSDYSQPATANMGVDHMNAMVSNMMLFQTSEISFGNAFFAGGTPEAMRPQIERGHRRFRFLLISPMRKDGGVELVLGTLPEELKMLEADAEFTKYAKLVDSQEDRQL